MTPKQTTKAADGTESGELEQVKRISLKEKQLSIQIQAIEGKQGWRGESYHGLSVASLAAKLGNVELKQISNDGHAAMVQALVKSELPLDLGDGWWVRRRDKRNICLDKNSKKSSNMIAFCGTIQEMARPIIENIVVAGMTVDSDLAMTDQVDVLRRNFQTRLNAVLMLINKHN